jgi:hypothetical protein
MDALQSEPDKVLMLVNLEQKKRREREHYQSNGPLRLLIHRLHRLIK